MKELDQFIRQLGEGTLRPGELPEDRFDGLVLKLMGLLAVAGGSGANSLRWIQR